MDPLQFPHARRMSWMRVHMRSRVRLIMSLTRTKTLTLPRWRWNSPSVANDSALTILAKEATEHDTASGAIGDKRQMPCPFERRCFSLFCRPNTWHLVFKRNLLTRHVNKAGAHKTRIQV